MLGLAALYTHKVLQSHTRVESHRLIAQELSDYRLRWHDKAQVNTQVFKIATPHLALYSMSYGDEVDILPQAYDDFLLVHYAKHGCIEVEADGHRGAVHCGEVLISNPHHHVALRWSPRCEQVILRVPRALIGQTLLTTRDAPAPAAPTLTRPAVKLGAAATRLWQVQLDALCAYAQEARQQAHYLPWLNQVEHSIAQFLAIQLWQQAQTCTEAELDHPALLTPTAAQDTAHVRRRKERLQAYVATHTHLPITLDTLAQAAALSPRHLTRWMQREYGSSPLVWLRQHRLQSARQQLLQHPARDVTQVVLAHGFAHLGRFSQYYKSFFGELPSDTRKRHGLQG